jgi:hypothetical protein
MASPFKHFRKHQKAMLAVIGILCMIGFTIGPSTLDWLDVGRAAQDPIVATANGEKIRQTDISQMERGRYLANRFVVGCLQLALKEQFMFLRFQYGDALEQYFGPTTEESVVQTHLLAERARQIGLIVSDDAVNEFLRSLTQDKVPREGFKSLVKEMNTTQAQVFSALRTELAAQRLREMSLPGGETTPAQRWDYYRRLKQRAVVEAAPVSVVQFVEEVADPSQEELAKFFDEHKEQEPQPLSPTPGFKMPKQAAFQYFVAEYSKFYDESAVTQGEIEKHYEANKDVKYLYSAFDFPEAEEPAAKEPEAKNAPAEGKQEEGNPDDEQPEAEKKPAPEEKSGSEKQDPEKPAAEKPADGEQESAGETKKDEDAKADEQSSTLSAASNAVVAAVGSQSSQGIAGLLQSALLADEEGDKEKTPAAEEKSEEAAKSNADAEKPAEEKPGAEAAEKSDSSEKAKAEPSAAVKKSTADLAPPISNDLLLIRDIREGEKPKYAPLWKVEGAIRKELAGQKAVERMNKAFGVIQAKMSRFNRNLDPDETNPKLPDLTSAAESQQLIERTTELQTALAFKEGHPALADATPDQQSLGERPLPMIDLGYGALTLYRNVIVKDLAGNRYLVWKIEEKDDYVPELNDVRDEVVLSWKQIQARELARKRAEALVEKAQESKKPLAETLGAGDGVSVTTTPAFSWLTRGAAAGMFESQTPPRLSEVEGLQHAGSEFMRKVFSLGVGETGEAMNEPQSICYVVRVVSLEPSREVLRNLFMVDAFSTYEAAAFDDRRGAYEAWIKGIEHEANLEWKKPPDKPRGQASAEE